MNHERVAVVCCIANSSHISQPVDSSVLCSCVDRAVIHTLLDSRLDLFIIYLYIHITTVWGAPSGCRKLKSLGKLCHLILMINCIVYTCIVFAFIAANRALFSHSEQRTLHCLRRFPSRLIFFANSLRKSICELRGPRILLVQWNQYTWGS